MDLRCIMNPVPRDEEPDRDRELEAALREGYVIVNSRRPPPPDLVNAALAELKHSQAAFSRQWGINSVGVGQNCERLFEEGFDVSYNSNRRAWCAKKKKKTKSRANRIVS
jgi:hypothetical protein